MNIRSKILSAILAASLAFSAFAAPALEINASALSSYSSTSANSSVPDISITENSFINYTYGILHFQSNYTWLYDFCDEMHTGIGNRTDDIAFVEMYYGIHAYVKDDSLYFKFYNNSKQDFVAKNAKLVSDLKKTDLNIEDLSEYTKLDTSDFDNGLYKIEMTAHRADKDSVKTPVMYFYVNGGKTYLCAYTLTSEKRIQPLIDRRKTFDKLIKENGITPENSLSTESLCFPWNPSVGCNDIPKWTELAKTIVKDEWSDSLKAFAIHEWMTKNLSYDYYKVNVIKLRRASYYKDYSGKYDMYQTKVGVCFDFANIYAAMCRSVGVPAVTVDTATHSWNAIYIDGKWREADLTTDVNRGVYGEDVTKVTNADRIYSYDGYCTLKVTDSAPEMINRWLWNYDNSKGYK